MQSKNSSGLKRYFAVFFLMIISGVTIAQGTAQRDYQIKQLSDYYRSNKMVTSDWNRDLTLEDIEGTPFLEKDYIKGSIYTVQKQKFLDVPLRYNMYNDKIEFQSADGASAEIAAPDDIEKIEFGDYKFGYVKFQDGKKGYLQVLESGVATLYVQHKVLFRDKKAGGAYQEAEKARFERVPAVYFIGIENEPVKKVSGKKDLEQAFPERQAEVDAFVLKNKIKANKPDGLMAVVKYYNSL